MIYLLNKNNMKKLAYIATIACSMFLTTSCVDLTQEPQSFITDEDYIASMDLTGLQQAATGLYNDLWNGNYGFNCRLQRINVCADDITYRAAKLQTTDSFLDIFQDNLRIRIYENTDEQLLFRVLRNLKNAE